MRDDFEAGFLPINVGSLPHTDPEDACNLILTYLPELPGWPQLPRRSFLENMYVQFSEGFPGVALEEDRIYVDRAGDLSEQLERLYAAYLENNLEEYAVSPAHAAGLARWSRAEFNSCEAVKGQVTGPISWGLSVVDQDRRPILYDEVLSDAVARHLRLKAAWQEGELRKLHATTMIFLDEPYMASYGSPYVAVTREQAIALIEEVLDGLDGLRGIHCCGNTDWSLILNTSVDILSFDTYDYAESLSLYPAEVKSFLRRGGIIAWGIAPREEENLARETTASLVERLHEAMQLLVGRGIPFDDLLAASLVSPCCGLGFIGPNWAERALSMTVAVSREMRRRYLSS